MPPFFPGGSTTDTSINSGNLWETYVHTYNSGEEVRLVNNRFSEDQIPIFPSADRLHVGEVVEEWWCPLADQWLPYGDDNPRVSFPQWHAPESTDDPRFTFMPRCEDMGVKKYLQVPRSWYTEWTPQRHVSHAVNYAMVGTLPLGAHGVIDLSRLHEALCSRHWSSYRVLSAFMQSSDIGLRATLEYQKRHAIVDRDSTVDALHARDNDKCLTLTNFLQQLKLPKSSTEVIVAEKPTFTELGVRPDSVLYVKESSMQAARRLDTNAQAISTEH